MPSSACASISKASRRELRTFEYFVGPTNSGKTHAAIELLRAAESGVYLAPLRLLALEVYERLNDLGAPASLVTGEERVIDPQARYVSSTVEMVDLGRRARRRRDRRSADARGPAARLGLDARDGGRAREARRAVRLGGRAARGAAPGRAPGRADDGARVRAQEPAARRAGGRAAAIAAGRRGGRVLAQAPSSNCRAPSRSSASRRPRSTARSRRPCGGARPNAFAAAAPTCSSRPMRSASGSTCRSGASSSPRSRNSTASRIGC